MSELTKNEKAIFKYLTETMKLNCAAACGIIANFAAESGCNPNNLQNSCEKRLRLTNETYTAAVDDGTYNNFTKDAAGYGLAQWTHYSRKQKLYDYAKKLKKSIGDLEMQLAFFALEIKSFPTVWNTLKTVSNDPAGAYKAGYSMCYHYEAPATKATSAVTRGTTAKNYFESFSGESIEEETVEAASTDNVYTVKAGDTLTVIAKRYGTTAQRLTAFNELDNPHMLRIGQKIRIPAEDDVEANTYKVAKGDTLWKVAKNLLGKGSRYTEIKTLNGLKGNTIYEGQILKIPEE